METILEVAERRGKLCEGYKKQTPPFGGVCFSKEKGEETVRLKLSPLTPQFGADQEEHRAEPQYAGRLGDDGRETLVLTNDE